MRQRNIRFYAINCGRLAFAFFLCLVASIANAQSDSNSARFVAPRFNGLNSNAPDVQAGTSDDASTLANEETATEDENVLTNVELSEDETISAAKVDVTRGEQSNGVQREPYDVYKENGVYFEDWDEPEVVLVFTGIMNGYIEPCGCAGMERMKGGLSRRQTFLKDLRDNRGWKTILIDAGQITVGFGVQEELKFDMAMNAFQLMQYDVVGIGKSELRFPAPFLLMYTAPTSSSTQSYFTSANVGVYGFHPTYTLPFKIVERGGKKISVTSVICHNEEVERRDENIHYEDPEIKLNEVMAKLRKENCDSNVLIVHGPEEEMERLAKKFPFFDYIVASDGPSEPPAELREINDNQKVVEVGEKGKYAIVVGYFKDGSTRYQRVALDSRYESSPEITLLMKDYQSILKGLIVSKGIKRGLGINPASSPMADKLGKYVGAQKCRSCHEDAYRTWAKSKHATAWKSLTETANPPRDFDPECIGCHVVGWNGIQHFPYVDGFETEETTPRLANVGCESCHGPGERHIELELGDDEKAQERARALMRLGDEVRKVCYSCHDGDNSPEFEFETYYPLIDHSEEDDE